jgi:uncharacterized membrane protein YccC
MHRSGFVAMKRNNQISADLREADRRHALAMFASSAAGILMLAFMVIPLWYGGWYFKLALLLPFAAVLSFSAGNYRITLLFLGIIAALIFYAWIIGT